MKLLMALLTIVIAPGAFAAAAPKVDLNKTCLTTRVQREMGEFSLMCRSLNEDNWYVGLHGGGGSTMTIASPKTLVIIEVKKGRCHMAFTSENKHNSPGYYSGIFKDKRTGRTTIENFLKEKGKNSVLTQVEDGKTYTTPLECWYEIGG